MAGYIGSKASVVSSGAERKTTITATASQTSLTGLSYTPKNVHVFQNGIRLVDGTDYTATNGSSITLTVGASADDQIVVVSYATYQNADSYTKTESDTNYANVSGDTFTGAVTGTDLTLSGGVFLGGTGTANKLEDYEEGTWTPATPTGSWTVNDAKYVKIGGFVHCSFHVTATATVSNSDFTGLPFTPSQEAAGIVGYQNDVSGEVIAVYVQAANIWNLRIGSTQYGLADTKTLRGSFTYPTDA